MNYVIAVVAVAGAGFAAGYALRDVISDRDAARVQSGIDQQIIEARTAERDLADERVRLANRLISNVQRVADDESNRANRSAGDRARALVELERVRKLIASGDISVCTASNTADTTSQPQAGTAAGVVRGRLLAESLEGLRAMAVALNDCHSKSVGVVNIYDSTKSELDAKVGGQSFESGRSSKQSGGAGTPVPIGPAP